MSTAPRRAFSLTMKLDADTREDLVHALHRMAEDIAREQVSSGVWGGPSDGAVYELLHNPHQTHHTYFTQLREYLADQAKAKGAMNG